MIRQKLPALSLFLSIAVLAVWVRADSPVEKPADVAPPRGVRLFVCGHSFHAYVGRIMPDIAAAGIRDQTADVMFVGGSSVTQCWEIPDPKNDAKNALRKGKVDVLTLSAHVKVMPDPAIQGARTLSVSHPDQGERTPQRLRPAGPGGDRREGQGTWLPRCLAQRHGP